MLKEVNRVREFFQCQIRKTEALKFEGKCSPFMTNATVDPECW